MKKSKPTRMCITCRGKYPQNTLLRLKKNGTDIIVSDGKGRSFYLCKECRENEKKVKGLTKRFRQNEERFVKFLKAL